MLLLRVDVVHFTTLWALLNVPPAVTKMCGHFRLGELLMTIITHLYLLLTHLCLTVISFFWFEILYINSSLNT